LASGASLDGNAVPTPNVYSHRPPASYIAAVQGALPAPITVWNGSADPPVTITYNFETVLPPAFATVFAGEKPFTDAQKAEVRSVLAEYQSIINVQFVETALPAADIEFGRANLNGGEGGQGGYQYAYATLGDGTLSFKTLVSYAVFDERYATIPANTILHEVGHALTLKHPGNYDAGGGSAPGPYLPASLDSNKYSVMSYHADPDNGARSNHLMLFDIAALQARFGANLSYRTGNDTYTAPNGGIEVIWDAGGNDTISGAGRKMAVTINLNDGTFSSLGARDNLAIAYGVIIENATGGARADRLVGNQWDNRLMGGAGSDTLTGGAGNDVLIGGPGNDVLIGGAGHDTFVFNAVLNATRNVDRIKDFRPGVDIIALAHTVFTALAVGGEAQIPQHIYYNAGSGALFYDANGNGAGRSIEFAKLMPGLSLHSSDFLIV